MRSCATACACRGSGAARDCWLLKNPPLDAIVRRHTQAVLVQRRHCTDLLDDVGVLVRLAQKSSVYNPSDDAELMSRLVFSAARCVAPRWSASTCHSGAPSTICAELLVPR